MNHENHKGRQTPKESSMATLGLHKKGMEMKYYILKIYTKSGAGPFICEVNKRTLDYFLGPWQDEGRMYRYDDGEETGFFVYREEIACVTWDEVYKECNQSIHIVKE